MSDQPAQAPVAVDPVPDLNDLRRQVLEGKELDTAQYRLVLQSLRNKRNGDIAAAAEKPSAKGAAKAQKTEKDTRSLAEILAAAAAKVKESKA